MLVEVVRREEQDAGATQAIPFMTRSSLALVLRGAGTPERIATERPLLAVEHTTLPPNVAFDFTWDGSRAYRALHDMVNRDGEIEGDGIPRTPSRDMRRRMTLLPEGVRVKGWVVPESRVNSFTALYFDQNWIFDQLEVSASQRTLQSHVLFHDRTLLPTLGAWTDVARMRAGRPVVVHGDGTSLWTLTHTDDFAVGFVGLLGHPHAVGDTFQIMGTHAPTWEQVYTWLGAAAGVPDPEIVHVPSEAIARVLPDVGDGLLGDKAHSMLFDCAKLQALVPEFATTITYDQAAHEQIAWYDAHPEAQAPDAVLDAAFDRLVEHARSI